MSDPIVFKYDTIVVYHVGEIQFGKPALSIDNKLDEMITKSSGQDTYAGFEQWAESQRYPILSSVELQDGIYAANRFKLFADPLKSFGKDLSHYQYLKINQPDSGENNTAETGTPFDEDMPVTKETGSEGSDHLTALFKTKLHQLEKFMCHITLAEGLNQDKNIGRDYKTSHTSLLKNQAN